MARTQTCDLCEKPTQEYAIRGPITQNDYCLSCVRVVDAYLSEVNAAHDQLALDWQVKLTGIREKYARDHGLSEYPC